MASSFHIFVGHDGDLLIVDCLLGILFMIFVDVTYHHYNCIICYGMASLEVFVVMKTSWVWLVYFSQSNETCLLSLCAPLQFGSGAMSCFASYF